MRKLVLKTALITLGALIALTALLYGAFALFAPNKMVSFHKDMGNLNIALRYQERIYDNEQSNSNLISVVNLAIASNNDEKVEKYAKILIEKNDLSQISLTEEYADFVIYEYCVSLYNLNKKDKCLSVATAYSTQYNENDPIRSLCVFAIQKEDKLFLQDIVQKLNNFNTDQLSEENKQILQRDIAIINEYMAGE